MLRIEDRRPLLALFALCAGAVGLWFLGAALSQRIRHAYLLWNLVLAVVPLAFALGIEVLAGRRLYGCALALGVPWLLFLPNAPYILTDFIHLQRSHSHWAWVYLLLLVWFCFAGLASGLFSLHLVHRIVTERLGSALGWLFVGGTSLLTGLGVALGRFQRWNSWDIVHQPGEIVADLFRHLPSQQLSYESLVSTGIGTFFGFTYLLFWSFRHPQPTPHARPV